MNKIIILFFVFSINLFAQYQVQSEYLKDPSLAIGYVDSSAQFWFSAWDNSRGGFYTNVGKTGNVLSSWGTNKDMITQTRNAYGLVRAFMLTGKDEYLQKADEALEFIYEHAWDENYDGWFNQLDQNGNPTNTTGNKSAFDQHYALLGISAYYEATQDTHHLNWLMKGFENNEAMLWDSREDYFGYYDYGSYNWGTVSGKSFNATVDAITTHILYLYLMTKDDIYKNKLLQVSDNIINRLVSTMDQQAIGFAEEFNTDWQIKSNETMTLMGHVLKAGWCLARVYHYQNNIEYLNAAEKLIDDVLQKGYDHEFGGPYKDYNRVTGEMLMWGNPDTAKAWWQMEQAVVAGLQMYDLTGNDKYLQMADETLNFFMNYFVDHVYSEVYENRTRYGDQTWGEHKGNGYKAGYHSIELGYYNYFYGNLFYTKEPVELYYDFKPYNFEREIFLNPIAINDNELIISSIELDNFEYDQFNSYERTLFLPAGEGGKFKVVFEWNDPTAIANNTENYPKRFTLEQNYPNPFNPTTTIKYSIPSIVNRQSSIVVLKVFDILGREISTLVNKEQQPGNYEIEFNGSNLPAGRQGLSSGVYYYRLQAGDFMQSKKMILLK